jgi:hypothetical protein
MEETTWRKPELQEGFNLPGDDYFINVKRHFNIDNILGPLLNQIKKMLIMIPNPITQVDQAIESFLKGLLLLMLGQIDCSTGKLKTPLPDAGNAGFTWANGRLNFLNKNVSSIDDDIIREWKNTVEKFSMPETPDLIYTIQSFLENHPNLNKTALTTFYLKKLNAYEKSLGKPPSSNQIFAFNNDFDNLLADSSVISQIQDLVKTMPKERYPNTQKGFADYLQKSARFSFSNTAPISFYNFATQYFPYPSDLKGFETAVQDVANIDYVKNIQKYLPSLSRPADPPAPPTPAKEVDPNYAFSMNLNSTRSDSIQTYLKYISQWYSLLLYHKYNQNMTLLFPTIEANVCMVYITYLNAVEFQKYRIWGTYLTPYELAMFNHLFYICLRQDEVTFTFNSSAINVYNLALPPDGTAPLSRGTPSKYINLLPQSIFSLVKMFALEINTRVKYLSGSISEDNYQALPLDGVLILPSVPDDVMPPIKILLANYILDIFSTTLYKNKEIPDSVVPAKDIYDYFCPIGMSDCERENMLIHEECKEYAKKIKSEIYRMLCVPIMIYIAYNFYYMFFFKDGFDLVKKTDNEGNILYEREMKDCFAPIFPDWELMYHSFEGHQTDFFFEFIFKPVKMFYTFLNAFKAFFRKGFDGYVIKDHIPYVFFLISFHSVYNFISNRGDIILRTLTTLSKLKIPDVEIMGQKAFNGYAYVVTVIFFILSFLKKFFGFSISEMIDKAQAGAQAGDATGIPQDLLAKAGAATGINPQDLLANAGATTGINPAEIQGLASSQDKKEKTWVEWIMTPGDGAFTKIMKIIIAIIYWILKFSISINMVVVSKTIFTLYFLINSVMGIGNFTTPLQGSNYKLDVIHRIFYTKLCSSNYKTEPFKYFAKSLVFVSIYFLVELVILHNLWKGMKTFSSVPKNRKTYNTGLSKDTNQKSEKNSMAIRSFMLILNGILFTFVLLWCIYKAIHKRPIMVISYEAGNNSDYPDKRLNYECSQKDAYEEASKNSVLNTMMKSDGLNEIHQKQFNEKTKHMKKPSFLKGFIQKMGEYGKKINDKIVEIGETKYGIK